VKGQRGMAKLSGIAALASAVLLTAGITGCSLFSRDAEEIKVFTGYFAMNGEQLDKENDIRDIIAKKTGVLCEETWNAPNLSAEETVNDMIISGKYPDFIYGGVAQSRLLEANALIPINKYWDEYDNIKNYFTPEQWKQLEDEDGYIHYIPVYSNVYLHDTNPEFDGEAFWIQARVLEWAGYPKIKTLDQYFDVIEAYLKENPVNEEGVKNIGYEILTDGYFYFCMENPPQFLDGYPNDGCCIVDEANMTARDYNTTPTAEKWFKKLNEEYHKGVIDSEFSFITVSQYYEKIKSGAVLGMADQHWNFRDAEKELPADYQYIPLDLVIDESIEPKYRSPVAMDLSQGLGISVDCEDVETALRFIDSLLSPEIMNLRFWGVEGKDYLKDSSGKFYRNDAQRSRSFSQEYSESHFCKYFGFPYYGGMNLDGINAYTPENQLSEYTATLGGPVKRCLEAYGAETIADMLNITDENPAWYPMWSYTNLFNDDTDYGRAKIKMDDVKHRYLPKVIMSDTFESSWDEYMKVYSSCDLNSYFNELTSEVRRRAGK